MILITDRQGPDQGCYSTGEDAEPERDGHLVRYHLEWNALEKVICQLPTLDRSNLKRKLYAGTLMTGTKLIAEAPDAKPKIADWNP